MAVSVLFDVPVIAEPAAYVLIPSLHPPNVNPGLARFPGPGAGTDVPPVT